MRLKDDAYVYNIDTQIAGAIQARLLSTRFTEFSEVLPKHLVGELRIRANVVISTRFSRLGAIGET